MKWILGGLGWALLGPIGAIIGFLVGTGIEKKDNILEQNTRTSRSSRSKQQFRTNSTSHTTQNKDYSYNISTQLGDFMVSMLILISEIIKADGKILKSELDYVKLYFREKFGVEKTKEALRVLKILLNKNIPIYDVGRQIRNNLDYHSRLQLIHFLFGLSAADGEVHPYEVSKIDSICKAMGISQSDFTSIKAMFVESEESPFEILQISSDAQIEEIKAAYRKLAKEYHPDRVAYLGEEVQREAKEKFQKINLAYDKLKKIRNFN